MIPTGSAGRSWLTPSNNQNAPDIKLDLPVHHVSSYIALLPAEYLHCVTDGVRNTRVVSYKYVPVGETFVRVTKSGSYDVLTFRQTTTTAPGFIDTLFFKMGYGSAFQTGPIEYHYGLTQTVERRFGAFMQKASGSPHLHLEPLPEDPQIPFYIPGDLEFIGTGSRYKRGPKFYQASGSGVERHHFLTGIAHMSTSAVVRAVYTSSEVPISMSLAANTVAVSNWLFSVGKTGLQALPFGIGFWQQNTGSVEILGEADFIVPSGSVSASFIENLGSLTLENGSLRLMRGTIGMTGSTNVFSGSLDVRGTTAKVVVSGSLVVNGPAATASLRGWPMGTIAYGTMTLLELSGSNMPNGTLYVQTATGDSYIRSQGKWFNFGDGDLSLNTILDGGSF